MVHSDVTDELATDGSGYNPMALAAVFIPAPVRTFPTGPPGSKSTSATSLERFLLPKAISDMVTPGLSRGSSVKPGENSSPGKSEHIRFSGTSGQRLHAYCSASETVK